MLDTTVLVASLLSQPTASRRTHHALSGGSIPEIRKRIKGGFPLSRQALQPERPLEPPAANHPCWPQRGLPGIASKTLTLTVEI